MTRQNPDVESGKEVQFSCPNRENLEKAIWLVQNHLNVLVTDDIVRHGDTFLSGVIFTDFRYKKVLDGVASQIAGFRYWKV